MNICFYDVNSFSFFTATDIRQADGVILVLLNDKCNKKLALLQIRITLHYHTIPHKYHTIEILGAVKLNLHSFTSSGVTASDSRKQKYF